MALYAQTIPTIRNNILTARFIGFFLLLCGPLEAGTVTR